MGEPCTLPPAHSSKISSALGGTTAAVSSCPHRAKDSPFTDHTAEHLMGEVKVDSSGDKKAVGCHLAAAVASGKARHKKDAPVTYGPNPPGYYDVAVEICDGTEWVEKKASSTFFPDDLTPAEVEAEVLSAFKNSKDDGDGGWEGTSDNGLLIRGYYGKDASNNDDKTKIATAFPVCKEVEEKRGLEERQKEIALEKKKVEAEKSKIKKEKETLEAKDKQFDNIKNDKVKSEKKAGIVKEREAMKTDHEAREKTVKTDEDKVNKKQETLDKDQKTFDDNQKVLKTKHVKT